jgi:hypothetical protein
MLDFGEYFLMLLFIADSHFIFHNVISDNFFRLKNSTICRRSPKQKSVAAFNNAYLERPEYGPPNQIQTNDDIV